MASVLDGNLAPLAWELAHSLQAVHLGLSICSPLTSSILARLNAATRAPGVHIQPAEQPSSVEEDGVEGEAEGKAEGERHREKRAAIVAADFSPATSIAVLPVLLRHHAAHPAQGRRARQP